MNSFIASSAPTKTSFFMSDKEVAARIGIGKVQSGNGQLRIRIFLNLINFRTNAVGGFALKSKAILLFCPGRGEVRCFLAVRSKHGTP